MKNKLIFFFISILLLASSAAQTIVNKKLLPNDGRMDNFFGISLSSKNNFLAVGAPWNNNIAYHAGAVYIFKEVSNSWKQSQKIVNNVGGASYSFGSSVLISDDVLFVGATGDNSGAVYIYKLQDSIWIKETKITASDGYPEDYFGGSLNLYENNLIVGAYGYPGSLGFGKAYIYEKTDTGWIEIIGLSPEDLNGNDNFGYSVAITDSIAVIGAPQKSAAGSFSGSAYVYKNNNDTWDLVTILIGSRVSSNDYYGGATAIDNNFVLISAPGNIYSDIPGSVYVFENVNNKWIERDILEASDGFNGDAFGSSIHIKGDSLLIGASNWIASSEPGAAYLFLRDENDNWKDAEKFIPGDNQSFKNFGASVAMNDEKFFFGAPGDNTNGYFAGAVYYYPDDPVSVNDKKILNNFILYQNFPNPFNPETKIKYTIPNPGFVQLKVYDVLGKEIQTLLNEYKTAGSYEIDFNANGFVSGVYIYRIISGSYSETKKMIILR